jgi:uncharacterized protein YbjT (DUF2867 family)
MAELVDALVSGTSGATRGGSSPLLGTIPCLRMVNMWRRRLSLLPRIRYINSMTTTVVVFGGTGFIGRLLISRLAQAGYTVRVPTRTLPRAEPLRQLGTVGQVTPLLCDVRDAAQVANVLVGADAVVNCIGILAENRHQRFDVLQGEVPGIIARAAVAAGVQKFIHISAIGADANSPSTYARSKAAGEGLVRGIFPSATILRPSIVFGPDDGFFNRFARMACIAPALPLIGGGTTAFQPVYVADVADAILVMLTRGDMGEKTIGKTYELGGPAVYTFKKLMQVMLAAIGRKRCLVTIPWPVAMLQAAVLQRLPGQLLTRDQVLLLQRDNVVSVNAKTLIDLGITPTPLEAILPTYMDQYRPKGRF